MRRIVLASALVHGGLIGLLVWLPARARPVVAPLPGTVEFVLDAPPPPPSQPARAAPAPFAPPPVATAAPVHTHTPSPRVASVAMPSHAPVREPVVSAPLPEPAPAPSAPRVLTALSLQHDLDTMNASALLPTGPRASGPTVDARTQARTVVQGYVTELIAESNTLEPSHLHAYYGALARRMRETWRPGFYRTPDMVDTLMALPRAMAHYAQRYNSRALEFGSTGHVGPNVPEQPAFATDFEDRSSFSTRTTVSIVEVEQDETGAVRSIRVVRPARVRDFDAAALDAVRIAMPQQTPVPVPGGRRSRWAFEVAASRDAVVPIAGFTFNESNGFFEMNYPGALHVRTRVRPMGSRPLDATWPLPHRP